jgi:site-specific DNA recombinase
MSQHIDRPKAAAFSQEQTEKRVGLWIRVSTEDQAKGESPEHHEMRGRMYAEMKGWTVVEVYHMEGISGKSVKRFPEAQRMMQDIETGRITGLIFSKLERLARNTRELLDFADYFNERGADLISLGESIDTSTPHGRFFYTNLAALAQLGREETAYRVAASVPVRAKLGRPLGGAGPFGYHWESRQLVPHPQEAPVRKLMYELFAKHKRLRAVARLLNEAGYRTRNGSKFTDTTVKRLIRDPTAKGLRRANYTKSLGEKKHWKTKPESEWVYSEIPAIVSPELWEECNALLQERSWTPTARPSKKAAHLFSGFVFCTCGGKMYVPSNTPRYVCGACRTKIPEVDVERLFQQQLKSFFFSPEAVASHFEQGDQVLAQKSELLSTLEAEQGKVKREMEQLYRLYMGGNISPEGFGKKYKPLEERAGQLEEELPRLQAEVDFLRVELLSSQELVESAQDLYTRWTELPFEERRTIVESLVERITVGGGEVSLALLYLPAAPQIVANGQRTHKGSSLPSGKSGPGTGVGRGLGPR